MTECNSDMLMKFVQSNRNAPIMSFIKLNHKKGIQWNI